MALSNESLQSPGSPQLEGGRSLYPRMSWGAIVAGVVVALSIGLMLNALGAGIGASTVDAVARDTPSAFSFGIGAAIWMLVSNLIGLAAGGYVSARLSGAADDTNGTLHGVAVWGTTFLVSAVLLGNLVSGIASTASSGAASVVSGVARGTGSAVSVVGQQVAGRADSDMVQGLIDRAQNALRGGGGPPTEMSSDQRMAEIGTLITRRVTGGALTAPERDRLTNLVASEYRISLEDARARVQQVEQQAVQTVRQAEETARRAADVAASSASKAGFAIFVVMLLGCISAVLGARRGTRDLLVYRGSRPPALN